MGHIFNTFLLTCCVLTGLTVTVIAGCSSDPDGSRVLVPGVDSPLAVDGISVRIVELVRFDGFPPDWRGKTVNVKSTDENGQPLDLDFLQVTGVVTSQIADSEVAEWMNDVTLLMTDGSASRQERSLKATLEKRTPVNDPTRSTTTSVTWLFPIEPNCRQPFRLAGRDGTAIDLATVKRRMTAL